MGNRHYTKAPIIEAVIDIQVALPSDFSVSAFDALATKLDGELPIRTKITSVQMHLDANLAEGKDAQVSSTHDDLGLRLTDSSNSRVLQLRKIGFAYSHLPPYSTWECFSKEARSYWDLFVRYCQPEKVTRCAVRYVNRIDIPTAPIELKDYMTLFPEIPDSVPQDVTGMLMQLQMPQNDLRSMAVIHEAVVEPAIPGGLSIILDIDLFKNLSIDPGSSDVWDALESLRVRKNLLFEGFITNKTRELIQ